MYVYATAIIQVVLLVVFLIGRIYLCYKHIRIDPKMPAKYYLPVEINGEKWIVLNPTTKWDLIKAIHKYISWEFKSYRIKLKPKLLPLTSFLIAVGVGSFFIRADTDFNFNKDLSNFQISKPKPQFHRNEDKFAGQNPIKQVSKQENPIKQVSKQELLKLNNLTVAKNVENIELRKDEADKLNEKIHRINEKLTKIKNQLDDIEKKFPSTEKIEHQLNTIEKIEKKLPGNRNTIRPLHQLRKEVYKTIAEVNQIQRQVHSLTNDLTNGTIKELNDLQKQVTGITGILK